MVKVGNPPRNVEIQIRTHEMHNANELGVAAHWLYKEGGGSELSYQRKIAWLRQLLDWQREMADDMPTEIAQGITEDRIYVFTPNDEVVSLPVNSTPLDFAYYIHSEVGHRCRGAKVNGRLVQLTYALKLGDRIDILTAKEANPSRDWLNPQLGYLTTARSRAKVHAWFKKRDYEQNLLEGQGIFQRETKRLNLNVDTNELAKRFHLNSGNDMLAALGCGDIRLPQLVGALQELLHQHPVDKSEFEPKAARARKNPQGILVAGVDDLLTQIAHCCKPLPGEPIIGYTTVGRGITVHRLDCKNTLELQRQHPERILDVTWGEMQKQHYPVDLVLEAHHRKDLLRDITRLLSDENLNIIALNSNADKSNLFSTITLTIELNDLQQLGQIQQRLLGIKDVLSLQRQ